jgi:hypothetical protein
MVNIKANKIYLHYDKRQKDFVAYYPRKCDGGLVLSHILGDILRFDLTKWGEGKIPYTTENFKKELEQRGYDLTTLKFSIELKKE